MVSLSSMSMIFTATISAELKFLLLRQVSDWTCDQEMTNLPLVDSPKGTLASQLGQDISRRRLSSSIAHINDGSLHLTGIFYGLGFDGVRVRLDLESVVHTVRKSRQSGRKSEFTGRGRRDYEPWLIRILVELELWSLELARLRMIRVKEADVGVWIVAATESWIVGNK
jgi:hypothetical protein